MTGLRLAARNRAATEADLGGSPRWLLVLAALAGLFLLGPIALLAIAAPWSDLVNLDPAVAEALRLTIVTATIATAFAVLLGVPLGWAIERANIPARRQARIALSAPMLLPPVVAGLALIETFGRQGLLGAPIDSTFGFRFFGNPAAVVLAQLFVGLPFVAASVSGALQSQNNAHELASATLGASRSQTLWRVTLPLLRPAIGAGAMLSWARAVGELGATLTFAGSLPGRTRTMPIAILTALETDPEQARLLALVLLLFSVVVLIALRTHWTGIFTERR
ncbi:MAG: molybdate ABC transporter permease subunit [Acidimicrobiales bacterium]